MEIALGFGLLGFRSPLEPDGGAIPVLPVLDVVALAPKIVLLFLVFVDSIESGVK